MSTLITGNTYPVRAELRRLGGTWDARTQGWRVPDAVADQARSLVRGAAVSTPPTPKGYTYTIRYSCGHSKTLTYRRSVNQSHIASMGTRPCSTCTQAAQKVLDEKRAAEICTLLFAPESKIIVTINEHAADGWGSFECRTDAEFRTPLAEAWSDFHSGKASRPFSGDIKKYSVPQADWEKGKDISAQWKEWARQKLAKREAKEQQENDERAAALAKAKDTGEDQYLYGWGDSVDDGEGGECYGNIGVFIRPDGTTYQQVTSRAY